MFISLRWGRLKKSLLLLVFAVLVALWLALRAHFVQAYHKVLPPEAGFLVSEIVGGVLHPVSDFLLIMRTPQTDVILLLLPLLLLAF